MARQLSAPRYLMAAENFCVKLSLDIQQGLLVIADTAVTVQAWWI